MHICGIAFDDAVSQFCIEVNTDVAFKTERVTGNDRIGFVDYIKGFCLGIKFHLAQIQPQSRTDILRVVHSVVIGA